MRGIYFFRQSSEKGVAPARRIFLRILLRFHVPDFDEERPDVFAPRAGREMMSPVWSSSFTGRDELLRSFAVSASAKWSLCKASGLTIDAEMGTQSL
jgi:hypothetical protein